jgi:serine/threonine-protein kinase
MLVTPKLRLVRKLGAGGMGAVWLADHLALSTQVVVKFVSEKLAWSSEAMARFSREASAASQVKSPHVVQMLDHGVTETGLPYIVMELLEGHDLADHLTPAGLPPREVVPIITQLGRALTRAHERGIVHRDIKPSNVFLCEMGGGELFVKLLDFGVAKQESATKPGEETRTGALVGSPYYMSPEQLMGDKSVDYRSDLWSLGVLAFEALTGTRPFLGETVGALTMQVHAPALPRPTQRNPALPHAIDAWFEKACAREPGARFQSAKELADSLATALDQEVPRGIALERSGPRPEQVGFADTAQASTGDVPLGSGASGGSGRKTGGSGERARSSSEAVSAPPPVAATGAGLSTTSGSRRDAAAWRPTVLIAVGALIAGVVGTRVLGGRSPAGVGPATPSGGSSSVASVSPPSVVPAPSAIAPPASATTAPAESTPSATASTPTPPPPKAPGATTVKRHAPPAPAPSAAPSVARPRGSDDDIR